MQDGRPYSTFGVAPFLWIEESQWPALQSKYRELSRQHHPDRVDPNDEDAMAQAEAQSAQINSDFAKLKDFAKRLECVVEGREAPKMPLPELASDYFELQDLRAESGASSPEYQAMAEEFKGQVQMTYDGVKHALETIARKYAFGATEPFAESDLDSVAQKLGQQRYLQRLLAELASI